MLERMETTVLAVVREMLSANTRLARQLALIEPTRKLARWLAGSGASSLETPFGSLGMPPGLSPHCSREISGAQVTGTGGSCYATRSLPA